jgi:hypothetical protein
MIELPYAGNDLSMIVMVPEKDVEKLGATLTLAKWQELRGGMSSRRVDVFLPRFKFETRYLLKEPLSALGMPEAFDKFKADFTGMTGRPVSPFDKLYISEGIHKAMIDVNEEGSEATAATAMKMEQGASLADLRPVIFRADRPFIFMIVHKPTDSILFLGRVSNPPDSTPAAANTQLPPWTNYSGNPVSRRNPVVTLPASGNAGIALIPSGEYQPLSMPWHKGMMVPEYNVDGGLKPTGSLYVPRIPNAPPGAFVVLVINIDPNGDVAPATIVADDHGLGLQVQEAAKGWKFTPPTARGKPVSTRITVKVTF